MFKQEIYDEVVRLSDYAKGISKHLWENPEVGGKEKASADYLAGLLEKEGFSVRYDEWLDTAFCAEWGSGSPVIAFLGEYDALPALSQKVSTEKSPVTLNAPGHGCGHNLLGTAALTACVALKNMLEKEKYSGTLRFYGCPEEELLSGKVKMIDHGFFDGCDIALSWHPMSCNMVHDEAYLASCSLKYHFHGISSHAAFAPERGRSALDAAELMNVGSNYLREHVIDSARIHYTTENYGYPPNIVPDKASTLYCIRAPHISDVKSIMARIEKIARGAAMMTETEVEVELISGCCEVNPNHRMGDLGYKNLMEVIPPEYTPQEIGFALTLQQSLDPAQVKREEEWYGTPGAGITRRICERDTYRYHKMLASSDSGDVSMIMPMGTITTACLPLGVAPHTWQAVAAAGSSIGEKGMLYAAKVLAGMCYDLIMDPNLVAEVKREFESRPTGYKPII